MSIGEENPVGVEEISRIEHRDISLVLEDTTFHFSAVKDIIPEH